ncbi:hypothetical protein BDB00DRAFT_877754 [Zychaea mexicana]|uniref:uncharacterized protein n=1 Tax=Zychaea mexicana TaxID=64656 RepID=UPI0022FDC918|nr:uncharacterized protein BDB00DRAFT_877754 [Zychaea mexicana]KAI9488130.1 hypothetical protein BDB00DRAFT_877754 [Zychaea mexicana]
MTNELNAKPVPNKSGTRRSISESPVMPMPESPSDRMAALKNLGATFQEGHQKISKVATPTEEFVPSFVDTHQVEAMAQNHSNNDSNNDSNGNQGGPDSLQDAGMATKVD